MLQSMGLQRVGHDSATELNRMFNTVCPVVKEGCTRCCRSTEEGAGSILIGGGAKVDYKASDAEMGP